MDNGQVKYIIIATITALTQSLLELFCFNPTLYHSLILSKLAYIFAPLRRIGLCLPVTLCAGPQGFVLARAQLLASLAPQAEPGGCSPELSHRLRWLVIHCIFNLNLTNNKWGFNGVRDNGEQQIYGFLIVSLNKYKNCRS